MYRKRARYTVARLPGRLTVELLTGDLLDCEAGHVLIFDEDGDLVDVLDGDDFDAEYEPATDELPANVIAFPTTTAPTLSIAEAVAAMMSGGGFGSSYA